MRKTLYALALSLLAALTMAQRSPAQQSAASQDTTTPAQPQSTAQASGNTTTENIASENAMSPIEEWQILGGDINPYNGWAESSESVTYGLSQAHHHRARRRWRHR